MVGWHHHLNGCEFVQTPGNSERQSILVCCSAWGHKELDTTQQLNNNNGIQNNYYNKSCSVPPKKFKGSSERASLVVQTVKNSPAMQETWVLSLGQEDPLEKGMGTHSSIFAWRIPWTEEPSRLLSMELQRGGYD